jgi:Flp pilus assembly protein TadG
MPFLALLLIALIEVGFLLHAHVQVASATREAARAASLYASTRYASFDGASNPPSCAAGIGGWSLQQTIEQAVVRRASANNDCPSSSGTIEYSALGRLNTDQAAAGTLAPPCPSGSATGWVAGVNPAFTPADDEVMPTPGSQATLTLCYPYRLLIAADLFNYYGDPIWINKSVVFRYQQ